MNQSSVSSIDAAAYIADMADALVKVAKSADLGMLAYLLEMAALEAREIAPAAD